MSDVNRIGIQQTHTKIKPGQSRKEPAASGKAFDIQLRETVEKLQALDNAVDTMLTSTKPQKGEERDASQQMKSKKEEIVAENFSAAQQASGKSAKYIARSYEQARSKL